MAWPAIIGAGASLASGLISSKGTKKANAQQIALAREQMDFQERMSSTAYQRAADDLEKAGLNRILALGSPASSPGGAMPNISNELQGLAEGIGAAAHSAADLSNKRKQGKLIDTQNYATEHQGLLAETQALQSKKQAELLQEQVNSTAQDVRLKTIEADWMEEMHSITAGTQAAGEATKAAAELLKVLKMLGVGGK